jgi:hypothetical protein
MDGQPGGWPETVAFSTDEGAASDGGQEFEVSPTYIDRPTSRRLEVPSIERSISTRFGRKLRAHK